MDGQESKEGQNGREEVQLYCGNAEKIRNEQTWVVETIISSTDYFADQYRSEDPVMGLKLEKWKGWLRESLIHPIHRTLQHDE